ncbi:MAG: DNA translocase FtsK, partial [Christensenellaceae bacterium]
MSFSNIFSSNGNGTDRVRLDPSGTGRKFQGFDRILERQKRLEKSRSRAGLFDDDTAASEPNINEGSVSDRTVREEREYREDSSAEERERGTSVTGSFVPPPPVKLPSSEEASSDALEEELFELPEEPAFEEPAFEEPIKAESRPMRKYSRPPLELFNSYDESSSVQEEEIETNKEIIVRTLAEFKIDVEVKRVTVGPAFTRYDIETPPGVVSTKIMGYDRELGRKLHAEEVNVYPNYKNGFMAIEVPNKERSTIGLVPILRSPKFQSSKPNALTIALGKDVEGRCICGDISEMTHVLVAGSSGSGKSVFLNSLIVSLLMKYSPDELRLILIDPKLIEFVSYQGIPHLLINEIVNDPERVINVLDWISQEMDRRYHLFRECSEKGRLVRNVAEYNQGLAPDEVPLPKIVVIIDELADLMLKAKKEIENRIQELTQKSRASGIHLIIATQRPSVDVITGVIKSNMPTRIAFTVASFVDSKTILDEGGADKLLGKGDMIWKSSTGKSMRLQSPYLDSEEVSRVIGYIKENNEAVFDSDLAEFLANANRPQQTEEETDEVAIDPVNITALRYVVSIGQASISMVQRRCGVGYNRAGKIIEWMEQMG